MHKILCCCSFKHFDLLNHIKVHFCSTSLRNGDKKILLNFWQADSTVWKSFKYAIKPAKPILLIRVSIFSRFPKFNRDPLVSGKGYLPFVFSRTSADYHIKTRQGRDFKIKELVLAISKSFFLFVQQKQSPFSHVCKESEANLVKHTQPIR